MNKKTEEKQYVYFVDITPDESIKINKEVEQLSSEAQVNIYNYFQYIDSKKPHRFRLKTA